MRHAGAGTARLGIEPDLDAAHAHVAELVALASDARRLAGYAEACPVGDAGPPDYAPRELRLRCGVRVIAGIHFRGLSTDFPFVDVSAQTEELPEPVPLEEIAAPFARFRPRAVRLWRSPDTALPEDAEEDLVVVAGDLRDLARRTDLPSAARVELVAGPGLDAFDDYRATYAAVMARVPEMAAFASAETRESLASCVGAGAFFQVCVDGEPAGFIASRPERYRAWSGWNMVEQVLHPDHQGRGLAPIMQQALVRRLDPARGRLLFGTIAAGNEPSLRTARRVGRRAVEIGTFLPVPESG